MQSLLKSSSGGTNQGLRCFILLHSHFLEERANSAGPLQDLPEPHLPEETRCAFDVAYENIRAFHAAQKSERIEVETMPGVWCSREARPIGEPLIPLNIGPESTAICV